LHSDGGGEYTRATITQYLESKGIKQKLTTLDTLQHNGIAECMNQTLLDKVWAMLLDASLPEAYWYDALKYTALIHNVTPTWALGDLTPKEAWSGNKPNISCLHVFGSQAFVHVPEQFQGKLAARSLVCTFIGYAQKHKAYCLVHYPTCHFLEFHDIIFNEGGPVTHHKCVIIKPDGTDSGGTNKGTDAETEAIPMTIDTPPTQPNSSDS
jgi:hypothetical protein